MHGPAQSRSNSDGTFATTCWECSAHCGALATVVGGKVVEYGPNPANPHSKGAFCIKGIRGAPGITYGPNRLLHPQRRVGPRGSGRWQQISWDEALDEMAERLAGVRRQWGPEAIVGATSGAFFSRSVIVALLLRSIGSPNWMINQDLCGGCRAISGKVLGLDITRGEDIRSTRTALVVGRNSQIADPVEWAALKSAKKAGARIIAIDPKRTSVAELADIWLAPRIGTDAAIALAMANVLISEGHYDKEFVAANCVGFDELAKRAAGFTPSVAAEIAGVPADRIVEAAQLYADGPSTFVSGHGIDASSVGVQTFRAFHALVAITGNVDRTGGNLRQRAPAGTKNNFELLHRPEFRLERETAARALGADRFPLWAGPKGWQTACHNPTVIDAMLSGRPHPVKALYASGVNILVTYPDTRRTIAALKALDFVAVAAHQMTPTAEWADIVLPKTTTLEEEEVSFATTTSTFLLTRAVVAPRGEARQEVEIAAPLLDRLEARGAVFRRVMPWRTQRQFNDYLLAESGVSMSDLETSGFLRIEPGPLPSSKPFATPSGKIELYAPGLVEIGLDPLPGFAAADMTAGTPDSGSAFPLLLITGDREKSYHHSRFRDQAWALKVSPDPCLVMHPSTALAEGLAEGDWVRVEIDGTDGACRLRLKLSEATPPDVVNAGMGWWRPDTEAPEHGALDININAVLSYQGPFDPVSGSSDIRGMRCRVTRVAA